MHTLRYVTLQNTQQLAVERNTEGAEYKNR
jgi:hypothetical protein